MNQTTLAKGYLTPNTILVLIAMSLGMFLVTHDISAVSVALPEIEAAFDSNLSIAQWVVSAHALAFAVFIVTGGRLADMYGRRLMLFIGAAIFGVFSLLCGLAPDMLALIGARAVVCIGAALLWPAVLGLTYGILPRERAGLAGGIIIGAAAVGTAVGPITGGLLAEFFGWRWVFIINLPIALLVIFIAWRVVPHDISLQERQRLDYVGIFTLSIGLLTLLIALNQAIDWGFGDPVIIVSLIASAVLLFAFIFIERRIGERALVPRDLMSNTEFRWACIAIALAGPTFLVTLLYLPQFLQKFLDFSPIKSGFALLPFMIFNALASFAAGPFYERFGPKLSATIGAAGLVLGILLFAIIPDSADYLWLLPGAVVTGTGFGVFVASMTTIAVTSVDESQMSLGGGIIYMFNIAGGTIGLVATTTVFSSISQREIRDRVAEQGINLTTNEEKDLLGLLVGTDTAQDILNMFDAQTGQQLVAIAKESFIVGFRAGMFLNAALAFVAFLIVLIFVGGRLRGGLRETPEEVAEQGQERFQRHGHRAHG